MPFHNMSWIQYPSYVSTAVEDIIEAQSLLARCMYVCLCVCIWCCVSCWAWPSGSSTWSSPSEHAQGLVLKVTNLLTMLLTFTVLSHQTT